MHEGHAGPGVEIPPVLIEVEEEEDGSAMRSGVLGVRAAVATRNMRQKDGAF